MSKCDELKAEQWLDYSGEPNKCYPADKVDAAIAELKDKIQMHDFFWEGCGFDKLGFKNAINVRDYCDKLKEENESLKAENESLKYSVATLETDLAMLKRWRKVSEELPEKDEWVFVIGNRMMQIAKMVEDGWIDDYYNYLNVTHWMPLPKPPEEVDNGLV